ncbi:MAG: NAD(P)-dependent oxidoreductase [Nitrospirae bacterium]|nr:NAD(P)-dependent oxidoreductase [Nitrospirota bacterium]
MDRAGKGPLMLVTGGAGYVGSTLMRDALIAGYRVRCLDLLIYGGKSIVGLLNNPNFELIKGDVRNKGDVEKALEGVDVIVHLAGIVGDLPCQAAPKSAYQINFHGTELLATLAKKKNIKPFVFGSTCSTYGIVDTTIPADEMRELNPVSLYAETKIDCEKLLLSLKSDSFHPVMLRYGTAYGVSFRTRFDLLINSFVYEALTHNKIVVFAANMWRPYVHVSDAAAIILEVLKVPSETLSGEIFNAGVTSQNFRKDEIVKIIQEFLPDIEVHFANEIDDKRNYRVDFTKLEQRIGFKPAKTISDGIRELIFCFKNNILTKDDYESNSLEYLKKFFAEHEKTLAR